MTKTLKELIEDLQLAANGDMSKAVKVRNAGDEELKKSIEIKDVKVRGNDIILYV